MAEMRILSFGGGVQTTALAILVAQGKLKVDHVVFADTGGEKPETYRYIEAYIKPLLHEHDVEFVTVRSELKSRQPDLYGWLYRARDIPNVRGRRECSWDFKRNPINANFKGAINLVGFSADEQSRADKALNKTDVHPLIEMGLTGRDCRDIISGWGWPVPVKSSCWFCPFQRPYEWAWVKRQHPDLFQKALDLEAAFYERKPQMKNDMGLFGGKPLWHYAEGRQDLLFELEENNCWSGACGR